MHSQSVTVDVESAMTVVTADLDKVYDTVNQSCAVSHYNCITIHVQCLSSTSELAFYRDHAEVSPRRKV